MEDNNFAGRLLAWYHENRRNLPWRNTHDPYIIWISEIILQQTRVAQGYDYFLRFMERFPDADALVSATEDEVLRCWQGLGYYSRARNLHAAAHQIAEQGGAETVTDIATIAPTRVYEAGLLPNMECDLWLRAVVKPGAECRFYYSLDGKKFIPAGGVFKARAGKWIGAKIGFYSITPAGVSDRGWMDIIDFDLKKL